ncbi:MAG: MaoC family dehydratase N-terminal domain-containing protein [Chloroflexi bacterium]|nr:MaoC family dehydratase N-terminal domain-containing protein [Chloroflexota bacterium]
MPGGSVEERIAQIVASVGAETGPFVYEVEKGAIRKFARAVEDPNPLWQDEAYARKTKYGGIIAPPTFLRLFRPPQFPAESPYPRRLDAGSDWEYFEPLRSGDIIACRVKLASAVEKEGKIGKMLILVWELTYVNQLGELVATQRSTLITY